MRLLFHLCSFLSAYLLFAIQPVVAKALLPALGGGAVVWGTCMVTFQGLLLLGYLASHYLLKHLSAQSYLPWHLALLALSAGWTTAFGVLQPAVVSASWPWVTVFTACLSQVGMPFLLLSFSTPLLQRWCVELGADPYPLFGASNAGSLLALVSYPFLVEPILALSQQTQCWRMGMMLLVGMLCVLRVSIRLPKTTIISAAKGKSLSSRRVLAAAGTSAAGTALLLSVTNAITFDISSAPLLWVLPLALYLLSFVIVFQARPWIHEGFARTLLPWWLSGALILYLMGRYQVGISGSVTVAGQLIVCGLGCWLVHARLSQWKPADERALTSYYVAMSAGGLAGSILVSWVLPVVVNDFLEYPLALAAVVVCLSKRPLMRAGRSPAVWAMLGFVVMSVTLWVVLMSLGQAHGPVAGFVGTAAVIMVLALSKRMLSWWVGMALAVGAMTGPSKAILWKARHAVHYRNHYGIYEVADRGERRYLTHGTTNHGIQNLTTESRSIPLSYYHRGGPAGELLGRMPSRQRRFGMVGLGAGAMAVYAQPGDTFEVFEIDPLNIAIAREHFSYLADREKAGVTVHLHQRDGRQALAEREGSFDVLLLDAFSSGSIPMHLLTVEALQVYLNAVKPEGIILMHISNRALKLRPQLASGMAQLGNVVYFKDSEDLPDEALKSSDWALFAPNPQVSEALATSQQWETLTNRAPLPAPWTDERSDLLSAWRW